MAGNTLGQALTLTSWGESHGPSLGGVLDGVPPGIKLNHEAITSMLNRRRPGQVLTTPRNEPDEVEFLSGLFEGVTLGTPIAFMVRNTNQRSADYSAYQNVYRPGHGDYTYQQKYGVRDHRGGGRASARTTIPLVVGGAIALQVLQQFFPNVRLRAGMVQLGPHGINQAQANWDSPLTNPLGCPDASAIPMWEAYLSQLAVDGLSCGAVIEVRAHNLPAGLGEPIYDRLDADLAKVLMGLNAVKAVEIGDGLEAASASQSYDEMMPAAHGPAFASNHAGGILAGISTGQPLVVRTTFKATSSTRAMRQSIDHAGNKVEFTVEGRHDPCVALRALPIVESAVAFVLADHTLRWRGQCGLPAV
jgi:chorismate synthase